MDKKPKRMVPEVRFKGFTDDWEQRKLGEVTTSLKSYSLTRKYETIDTTGYKYIHYGDIHTGKAKKIDNPDKLPSIIKGNYFTLDNGDIVVADASEDYQGIADAAILLNKNMFSIVAGLHTIAFRPNNKLLSSLFAYYTLQTSNFKHYGYRVGTGLKVFGISNEAFFNYSSFYPTFMEQQIISKLLNLVERLITLQQRKLKQLKQLKKAMLQQLFVNDDSKLVPNTRFQGFVNNWKKGKLSENIIEYKKKTTLNNQFPVLTSSRHGIFLQKEYYDGHQVASKNNIGYNIVPFGYFTYRHMSDDNIFKFNINILVPYGIVSTLYPIFSVKPNTNKYFVYYYLNYCNQMKRFALIQKQGGSRTYMYLSKLKQLQFVAPSLPEQTYVSDTLIQIDKILSVYKTMLNQLNTIKKFLLQKLFI